MTNWRDYLLITVFLALLGAASAATIADGPMSNMKGAWLSQAIR
jgi:hypothetical protein